jgi:uncharacterized protein (TIGR02646 family)
MRFIDIEQLELPDGWQARADEALNQLRAEIAEADAAALAAGEDPAAGRRRAITAGVNVPARARLWRNLSPQLAKLSKRKCWYSESCNPTADKNVDHFRPKSRVEEDHTHEGYWWLAFTWRNYRYSSQWCNQRRVDDVNGTEGGKWDHFPVRSGGFRARQETDDIELEEPDLLDPIDPEDWRLLTFRPDGRATPSQEPGTREYERAAKTIELYHLHCQELVIERRAVAGMIQRIVQDLERLRPQITDPKLCALYKSREIELLRAIHHHAEYSAAGLAYTRAEVYASCAGHQMKREWLEEILHSNP